jgi:hypothetical protein
MQHLGRWERVSGRVVPEVEVLFADRVAGDHWRGSGCHDAEKVGRGLAFPAANEGVAVDPALIDDKVRIDEPEQVVVPARDVVGVAHPAVLIAFGQLRLRHIYLVVSGEVFGTCSMYV